MIFDGDSCTKKRILQLNSFFKGDFNNYLKKYLFISLKNEDEPLFHY